MKIIGINKEAVSYRKYEDIICREDCVEETVSKEDAVNTPNSVQIVQEEVKTVTLEKR